MRVSILIGWLALVGVMLGCGDEDILKPAVAVVEPGDDPTQADSSQQSPWTAVASMPGARWQLAATAWNGIAYVAGGTVPLSSGWEDPDEILAYDPVRDVWSTVGHLLEPVRAPAMVAVNDRIYIIGGCRDDPFEPIATVQVFDPATGTVELGPPLSYGLCGSAAVVLDGRIHVTGGIYVWDPSDPLFGSDWGSSHEAFDPTTGVWSSLAAMPFVRGDHGAAVLDGKIYVHGGLGYALQVYDPATNSWASHSAPQERFGVAAVAFEGRMYEFGGGEYPSVCCGGPVPSATVDRLDPATGTWEWETLPPMPTAREGLAAVVLDGAAYVIGGSAGSALSVVERYPLPRR